MGKLAFAPQNSRAEMSIEELQEIYVKKETAPEVLRVEIDHLKEVVAKLELLHTADTSELETLVHTKHTNVGGALNEVRGRLTKLETAMVKINGDPGDKDDNGSVGRGASSLKKAWAQIDKAKDERWKLRLTMAGLGTGAGAGGAIVAKLLGLG